MISIADIWAELKKLTPPDGRGWLVRGVASGAPCPVLAAVRHPDSRPALLVEVAARTVRHDTQYPRSRGFELYPETEKPGPSGVVRLCLVLSDAYREDLFAILVEDVARAVANAADESDAIARYLQRLTVWQAFMQRHGDEGLSLEKAVGLYGELVCLERMSRKGMSSAILVDAWKGPLRGLRDYEFDRLAIEIKTTAQQPPKEIRISGLAQLDEQTVENLYVCHVALMPAGSDGETLNDLVEALREKIANEDKDACRRFEDLLINAGYVDGLAGPHADTLYRCERFTLYHVEDGFPRLTPRDVPDGIESCTYVIQLSALAAYQKQVDAVVADLGRGRGDE